MKKLLAAALLAMAVGSAGGCAYGGIATASDGTLYVTRNDTFLFGLLRKVFVCKPSGPNLGCQEAADAP